MSAASRTKQIQVGDKVYARYFGDDELIVAKIAYVKSPCPHYYCVHNGKEYLISKLYLSTRRISPDTEDGNRLQPPLLDVAALDSAPAGL